MQQRTERSHGETFDALVRTARERLYGAVESAQAEGQEAGPAPERTLEDLVDEWRDGSNGD